MILIGSRALMLRAPQLLVKAPLDFDFVCSQSEYETWIKESSHKVNPTKIYPLNGGKKMVVEGSSICEFEIIQKGESSELLEEIVKSDKNSIETPFGLIPSLDMLFTIKTSHRYLRNSPHFWKTLIGWHMMKDAGAKVRPEYEAFLKLREKETYWYKHPSLNQKKDSFFADDNITYVWDHDTIHESVAIYDRPAYTYYLKDGEQVQCDKNKFFSIDEKYRIAGVIEEACVLAIERSLVPHPGVWSPEYAWKFALSKVLSSITSGWFRQYGYENAIEILKKYPAGYWEKFQKDIESGLVKPFTKAAY